MSGWTTNAAGLAALVLACGLASCALGAPEHPPTSQHGPVMRDVLDVGDVGVDASGRPVVQFTYATRGMLEGSLSTILLVWDGEYLTPRPEVYEIAAKMTGDAETGRYTWPEGALTVTAARTDRPAPKGSSWKIAISSGSKAPKSYVCELSDGQLRTVDCQRL